MSPRSFWADAAPDPVERLHVILHQQYYDVCCVKLIESHAFNQKGVWDYILNHTPKVNIIYHKRKNILEQAISHEINKAKSEGKISGHPTHVFKEIDTPQIEINPLDILKRCVDEDKRYRRIERILRNNDLPVLQTRYEDITNGGQDVSGLPDNENKKVCDFLGVENIPLRTTMRKVHRKPFSEVLKNWDEVVYLLRDTKYLDIYRKVK